MPSSEGAEEALRHNHQSSSGETCSRRPSRSARKKMRICFQEWNATTEHVRATIATFCTAQAVFKVVKGVSSRETLFQSCDKWMKENGVRESSAKPWLKGKTAAHPTRRSLVRCDAQARAAESELANWSLDIDALASVELLGSLPTAAVRNRCSQTCRPCAWKPLISAVSVGVRPSLPPPPPHLLPSSSKPPPQSLISGVLLLLLRLI